MPQSYLVVMEATFGINPGLFIIFKWGEEWVYIPFIWGTCTYICVPCRQNATNLDAHQVVFHVSWAHILVSWYIWVTPGLT